MSTASKTKTPQRHRGTEKDTEKKRVLLPLCLCASVVSFFLFIFIAQPVFAASTDQVFLESKADRTEVTIGDLIHYRLTINMQKGVAASWPQSGSNLGDFDILDYQTAGPTKKEGRIIQTVVYTIAVYDTGVYHIPPVEIRYKTPEGEEKTVSAQGIDIRVKAMAPEKATDIKDIKGPLEMEKNWLPYRKSLLWVAASLVLALLAVWGWWYYQKKKAPKLQDTGAPLLPAHEAALAELKRIWDTLLKNNQIREFYFQLSEIIRQYLARRYQINALEATTEELIHELKNQMIHAQLKTLMADFLSGCDLVKFARYVPQAAETERLYQAAVQIVDNTRLSEADSSATVPEASVQQMQGQQG